MNPKYTVEPLDTQKHDRAAFSCGIEPLDRYLKERANKEANQNVAKIFVLCEIETPLIIGYYSLSAFRVETTRLPEKLTKRLPRYDALPAILLGRLAVDSRYRGQRFGERLLVSALRHSKQISTQLGALAVVVDAKDESAANFYERYDFRRFQDKPLNLFLPIAEIPD